MAGCTCCALLPPNTSGTSQRLKLSLGYHCRTPSIHAGDKGSEKQLASTPVLSQVLSACVWSQAGTYRLKWSELVTIEYKNG